ncbi:hypothetical protein GCG54_00011597 [Colletotrichum gloeosporioides]|uniref:Uncharacterized protein n=1 Tax=Colletotrichum gloeosporioides TaxID=474922 RepID=A0A8H4CSN4_COLGL|nr:uncharacterized protein GCG54_00011597 [Colletotrichum gloeosporioides]KAF3809398.1 hypothetical protein GCG54_00011597 [Colletotrichum gloeosporioides]
MLMIPSGHIFGLVIWNAQSAAERGRSVKTNGQEIRNIIWTAEQLALDLSPDLATSHIVGAMRKFRGIDIYVQSTYERLGALETLSG